MPRVVFDCMVFVQALANARGPAFACLELARIGKLDLCISPEVIAEVQEVLNRPKLQRRLPALTPERVGAFLEDVVHHATLIADVPSQFPYPRDPKDEPYINLALAAQARYLVSRDNDILDFARDDGFRGRFPGLIVLNPVALLQAIVSLPDGGRPAERGGGGSEAP